VTAATAPATSTPFARRWVSVFGRLRGNWLTVFGALWLVIVALWAIAGPWIAPYDAAEQSLTDRLIPPVFNDGTWSHVLGTDQLGRDLFSRIIVGSRNSLLIGVGGAAIEVLLGVVLAVLAGYFGGKTDATIMRWTEIQMALPGSLLVVFLLLMLGSRLWVVALVLALDGWVVVTRVVRVSVRRVTAEGYVDAARASGLGRWWVIRRHVLPQVAGVIVTVFLFEVPRILLAEAALSFIGLGIQPPAVSWGLIIGEGRQLVQAAYWLTLFPGFVLVLTVVSTTLLAGWLEPILDPERRRGEALESVRKHRPS
jgi:peptide/nickel transport system permease protein